MSDKIKKIKIKQQDGTMSDYYPIGADAQNIDFTNGYSLDQIVGDINPDEDGTLEVQLSKAIKYYNTVADMKADTKLQEGDLVETMGYYEVNDGGAAQYIIKNSSSKYYETLNNNLLAELIYNHILNVKCFGARGDNSTNDTSIIQNRINIALSRDTIFFPYGTYRINNLFIDDKSLKFLGQGNTSINASASTLRPINSNTEYLIKFAGTSSHTVLAANIINLTLDGLDYECDLVILERQSFFNIYCCGLINTKKRALFLRQVMESSFNYNVFRQCGSENYDTIHFGQHMDNIVSHNCNNIHIENCTFGGNSGNWIGTADRPNLDAIWIDRNKFEYDYTPSGHENTTNHSVIYMKSIGRCNINENTFFGFKVENNKYNSVLYFDTPTSPDSSIGTINITNNLFSNCENTGPIITTLGPTIRRVQ